LVFLLITKIVICEQKESQTYSQLKRVFNNALNSALLQFFFKILTVNCLIKRLYTSTPVKHTVLKYFKQEKTRFLFIF